MLQYIFVTKTEKHKGERRGLWEEIVPMNIRFPHRFGAVPWNSLANSSPIPEDVRVIRAVSVDMTVYSYLSSLIPNRRVS